jgi:predicted nucleotidyltransferase component of viral defense system
MDFLLVQFDYTIKQHGVNSQILLRSYMMERLLERIALSEYKENFILKGGMLVSTLVGPASRSTVDMDTTMKRRAVTI